MHFSCLHFKEKIIESTIDYFWFSVFTRAILLLLVVQRMGTLYGGWGGGSDGGWGMGESDGGWGRVMEDGDGVGK